MTFTFAPATTFTERAGVFVSLTGGTNSGKTFSALRLARGMAGPNGKVAVLDTEGGRTLHLKDDFRFDANVMSAPFRPERFSEAAKAAEEAGYDALVIDSFSMEWVGLGGVLDWQGQEIERMSGGDFRKAERVKMASWIKPKTAHKAMVYSFLQRRIPIIFSIRGEESVKPGDNPGDKPTKTFKSVCNSQFPYEVTVSFRLETERKGYIDLSDPRSFKMEGAHQAIFRHGERISEEHGEKLAAWARGAATQVLTAPKAGRDALFADAREAAERGSAALAAFLEDLPEKAARALDPILPELERAASDADARDRAGDFPGDEALRAAEKASA